MNKSVYLRGWVGFLGYECAQNLSTCNILSHLGVMGGRGFVKDLTFLLGLLATQAPVG